LLTLLARALGEWKPGSGRAKRAGDDALGAIVSLWPSIVGEDVAKHATPLERSRDALVVMTSSSAWSNQLSLLSGHIVSALSEAGIGGIERLRFKIGRIRGRASGFARNGVVPLAESGRGGPRAPAPTLEEAFSRYRERVESGRDAKRADGWNPCSKCGALLPEGTRCAPCTAAEFSERSARVQRLMFEVPWLGFRGISDLVDGLTGDEYEANRTTLLARWWEALERTRKTGKVSSSGIERQIASSYLLLLTGWEPDRITPAIARSQLGDEIYELIYEHHKRK
jgi:hypothetical protein